MPNYTAKNWLVIVTKIIHFISDKFNPIRPMGRGNWFLSCFTYALIYMPLAWVLPGMENNPAPPVTVLMLSVIGFPFVLLHMRRARAAAIPIAFIYIMWFLTPINLMTEGGLVEKSINIYHLVVLVGLVFSRNKLQVQSP